MTEREKFVTVATVEPCLLGDEFSKVPPHITLCPPFKADPENIALYHARMEAVMEENPDGITVQSSEPDNFGDNNEVPVLKTWLNAITDFPIHAGAFVGAQEVGEVDGRYAGLNWNPHISLTPGLLLPDAPMSLKEVQLFHYASHTKQVIAVYAARWTSILEQRQWQK